MGLFYPALEQVQDENNVDEHFIVKFGVLGWLHKIFFEGPNAGLLSLSQMFFDLFALRPL